MTDEIKTETPKEEPKTEEKPKEEVEDKEEEKSPLEKAREFNKETKEMLAEMKKERIKIEKAAAEMLVNGRSLAGQVQKQETPEDKWRREAKERYKGTGMDPT